jgi:hypothetical protein
MSEEILNQLAADMNKLLTEPGREPECKNNRPHAAGRAAVQTGDPGDHG